MISHKKTALEPDSNAGLFVISTLIAIRYATLADDDALIE
jgi:hypothetical protein